MEIELLSAAASEEWDRLIAEDPRATFFHTRHWARLLGSALAGMGAGFLVARSDGAAVAGMPFARVRRAGVTVLASMPFGTFGGPVLGRGAPPGAASALVGAFARLAAAPLVGAAHLVDFAGRVHEPPPGFAAVVEEAQVVRLARPPEAIRASYKPSARNKIRRAQAAGVAVRRASSEGDFAEYGDMLAECCRRWGTRCDFGPAFFRELSRVDPAMAQMWLAEHEGRIVAGDLNFALHDMVVNWGNVSRDSARALAPNNLLHDTAIEEGHRAGLALMNLGASAGIEGVDAFKASFGAERVQFRRFALAKPWYRALRRAARRGGEGGNA